MRLISLAEHRASSATFTESARFSAQVSASDAAKGANSSLHTVAQTNLSLMSTLGAFGEVRMCVHRESGAQRAVKVLRKSHMDDDEKRMLFNEINILKEIVSPQRSKVLRRI